MRILSDNGNRGVWYDAALQVEMDRNWGKDPGYYLQYAMNVQNALACLGHNLTVAGACEEMRGHMNPREYPL